MFESSLPDATPADRRQGRDPTGELARLMERERSERQKETEHLIAALAQLKTSAPGGVAVDAGGPGTPEPRSVPVIEREPLVEPQAASSKPRKRSVPLLLSLLAALIIATGVWSLVMPKLPMQASDVPGELTHRYVVPGFYQVEHVAVEFLRPLLHRYHIGIAPEWVFDGVVLLVAWMILRNLLRSFLDARRRRRDLRNGSAAAQA